MSVLLVLAHIISGLLVPGATLMLLFIVLSGAVDHFPFNRFYWVQVDTSTVAETDSDVTRWTFWGICHPDSYSSASQGSCPDLSPATPISPFQNWGFSIGLPTDFVDNKDTYFYLSRFAFALILIGLIFIGVALINIIASAFWKSFRRTTILFTTLSLLMTVTGACCGTAVAVLVKQKFRDAGVEAKLDAGLLGLLWASVFCLFVVFFLSCCSATYGAYKKNGTYDDAHYNNQLIQPIPDVVSPDLDNPKAEEYPAAGPVTNESAGIKFFKIRRNASNEEAV